ncbi:hypothetical protein Cantr_02225 [Candida viswanathii]|uniref:Uncharacterized protein n=1 Tax=Candida viswanathii TaxID=5486 RepID=A0A367YKU1_9ASCO|nr:hypothetical protein Cantr_02225 [Candida viswanathii]
MGIRRQGGIHVEWSVWGLCGGASFAIHPLAPTPGPAPHSLWVWGHLQVTTTPSPTHRLPPGTLRPEKWAGTTNESLIQLAFPATGRRWEAPPLALTAELPIQKLLTGRPALSSSNHRPPIRGKTETREMVLSHPRAASASASVVQLCGPGWVALPGPTPCKRLHPTALRAAAPRQIRQQELNLSRS